MKSNTTGQGPRKDSGTFTEVFSRRSPTHDPNTANENHPTPDRGPRIVVLTLPSFHFKKEALPRRAKKQNVTVFSVMKTWLVYIGRNGSMLEKTCITHILTQGIKIGKINVSN